MNLTTSNNMLDEISYDDAIFSKNHIYRKMNNLNNTYDIYVLTRLDQRFVWEKTDNYNEVSLHYEVISFDNLRYVNDENHYITIYRILNNVATDLMIYDEGDLVWIKLNIHLDINNMNTSSLLDISTHINLINDFNDPYDIINDFEPLQGWDNLLERTEEDDIKDYIKDPDPDPVSDPDPDPDSVSYSYSVPDPEESIKEKDILPEPNKEMRMDPYNGEWYTKIEFLDYYGSDVEWNHQHPKKVLLREEYCKFANIFSYLNEKKYIFLFKQYEKTFQ